MEIKTGRTQIAKLLAASLAQGCRLLKQLRRWKQAALDHEAALACRAYWRLKLGAIREEAGRWEEAAADYEEAQRLTLTSELSEAQEGIARVCRKAQQEAANNAGCSFVDKDGELPLSVCFLPPPSANKDLASARIRCVFTSDALNSQYAHLVTGRVGVAKNAKVIVICQVCTASTLINSAVAKVRGARIVYDCCDPYANYKGALYGIYAARRFWNLVALADAITVPTEAMQRLLRDLRVDKPIIVLPDTIDYQDQMNTALVAPTQSVVWFGNPDRGNFGSGAWALRALKDRWHYAVTLITNPSSVAAPADFVIEPWSYDGFTDRLRAHGLALVSQDPYTSYKSENRYVVSITNGIPTISTGSQSIAQLLQQSGFAAMSVANDRELDGAMERLGDLAYRSAYVSRMQEIIQDRFGPLAVGQRFVEDLLQRTLGVQFKGAIIATIGAQRQ